MTREQALETARTSYAAYRKEYIAALFGRAPKFDEFAKYGYRHGWMHVEGFCFDTAEITSQAYDHTQGGWAYQREIAMNAKHASTIAASHGHKAITRDSWLIIVDCGGNATEHPIHDGNIDRRQFWAALGY